MDVITFFDWGGPSLGRTKLTVHSQQSTIVIMLSRRQVVIPTLNLSIQCCSKIYTTIETTPHK